TPRIRRASRSSASCSFVPRAATTERYSLSLHDALPIWLLISGKLEKPTFLNCPFDGRSLWRKARFPFPLDQFFFVVKGLVANGRSEEHTSELQSREKLVCRLLLEKKKKNNGSDTPAAER